MSFLFSVCSDLNQWIILTSSIICSEDFCGNFCEIYEFWHTLLFYKRCINYYKIHCSHNIFQGPEWSSGLCMQICLVGHVERDPMFRGDQVGNIQDVNASLRLAGIAVILLGQFLTVMVITNVKWMHSLPARSLARLSLMILQVLWWWRYQRCTCFAQVYSEELLIQVTWATEKSPKCHWSKNNAFQCALLKQVGMFVLWI